MRNYRSLPMAFGAAALCLGLLLAGCHHGPGANFNSMSAADQKKAFTNAIPMTPELMQKTAARQRAIGGAISASRAAGGAAAKPNPAAPSSR